MQTEPLSISAVIPSFNRGHLVGRAISSALAQTVPPIEIIVVDDGSTDETEACVAAFGGTARYIRQDNAGAASARNRGVRDARGEWVAFLDSDDVWFPNHLQRIVSAINATEGKAGFYFSDLLEERGPARGGLWHQSGFRVEGEFAFTEDATAWAMMERQPMMLQTSVFHRASYLAVGGMWEKLWTTEDTHLFLRMSIGGPACAVAGLGGELLDDDLPARRLSVSHGVMNPRHWQSTLMLWEDILIRYADLGPHYRRILIDRCATSHRNLAAISFAKREFDRCLVEVLRYGAERLRRVTVR